MPREFKVYQHQAPPGEPPIDHNAIANAILELVEPGASRHCRRITEETTGSRHWTDHVHWHPRLDCTITVRVSSLDWDYNTLKGG